MTQSSRQCGHCGTVVAEMARFCPQCGGQVERKPGGVLHVLGMLVLALLAVALGAMGVCFLFGALFVGPLAVAGTSGWLAGAVMLLIGVLLLVGMAQIGKRLS